MAEKRTNDKGAELATFGRIYQLTPKTLPVFRQPA